MARYLIGGLVTGFLCWFTGLALSLVIPLWSAMLIVAFCFTVELICIFSDYKEDTNKTRLP